MSHSFKFPRAWILALAIFIAALYFLFPVYGFLSHKEKLPHWPIGWVELPATYPTSQILDNPQFERPGDASLAALAHHRESISAPAISAAVAINGVRVWAGVVGWQDIEDETPLSVESRFRIGSTSKALTATALARMMQSGVAHLDQPLHDVYEETPNPQWSNITPRQLASHSAGLVHYGQTKDVSGMYRFMALNKHYENVEEAVSLFDDTPLLSAPGEIFSYSSLGTVLLSSYMQRVGGKAYQTLIDELVLKPLKMGNTAWLEGGPRFVTHYWKSKKTQSQRVREWREVDLSHRLAGGGFISTSSDLVKLGSAYFDEKFLTAAIVTQIWQPQHLNSGEVNSQNYAIGWRKGSFSGVQGATPILHHGGVSRGAQSWLVVFPEYKMSIAINTNMNTKRFSDFSSVYKEIADSFISELSPK